MQKRDDDLDLRLDRFKKSLTIDDNLSDELKKHKQQIKSTLINSGIELFSCVIFGSAMGIFIDKSFSTKPIFLIIGFLLGFTTAFYNIIKLIRR